ncbi:hypothetical protein DB30_06981 [Enhygromyxa salina]|uniref:STAS/SEC14 domain-containing protein n=1 Tax=Enhygromyxa salina TaxID=215803 RepID=A0A0C2D264_9BACT|nr:STAS/SEC14 domain-containing protein [Enhygromyxa salina]KIG14232.1 hypothetical protein DB30_06981 [Enhygromyxa salina]
MANCRVKAEASDLSTKFLPGLASGIEPSPYPGLMPYMFDSKRAPLIYMHLHGAVTDSDLQRMLADMDKLTAQAQSYAVVLDCRELQVPELAQLQRLAGWFADNFDVSARYHRGVVVVVDSTLIRSSLRTLMQLQRLPMPIHILEDVEQGYAWAASKLGAGDSHRSLSA